MLLPDTLGLLLAELEPDTQPEVDGEMESDGDALGDAVGVCDTVTLLSAVAELDRVPLMVPEREPVWVREVEGVLVDVACAEPVAPLEAEDLDDADAAVEGVLEMHTLADTQPEVDSEGDTDAV